MDVPFSVSTVTFLFLKIIFGIEKFKLKEIGTRKVTGDARRGITHIFKADALNMWGYRAAGPVTFLVPISFP